MVTYRKSKKKKRFITIKFKLGKTQKDLLIRCANYNNTTIIKYIKLAVLEKMEKDKPLLPQKNQSVTDKNQLELFDFKSNGKQTELFEEIEKYENSI